MISFTYFYLFILNYNQIVIYKMLSAIDAPKSKSISIAFISLKSMILGLIFTSVFETLNK